VTLVIVFAEDPLPEWMLVPQKSEQESLTRLLSKLWRLLP
jgi:hypothetical protein